MLGRLVRNLLPPAAALVLLAAGVLAVESLLRGVANDASGTFTGQAHKRQHPGGYYTLIPGAEIASSSVRINSLGLRGPEPLVPKPTDTMRILILGDDVIFASDTIEGQTSAQRLGQQLRALGMHEPEVINGGLPGYCPLLSLLFLRDRLQQLDPDVVVLNFDSSDVADDRRWRRSVRYSEDGQLVVDVSPEESQTESSSTFPGWIAESEICRRIIRWGTPPGRQQMFDRIGDSGLDLHVRHALEPVHELAQIARKNGIRFVLTLTLRTPEGAAGHERSRRILAAFANEHAIEFCDFVDAFNTARNGGKALFSKQSMLTPAGHEVVAVQLAHQLMPHRRLRATPEPDIVPTAGISVREVRHATSLTVVEEPKTDNSTADPHWSDLRL